MTKKNQTKQHHNPECFPWIMSLRISFMQTLCVDIKIHFQSFNHKKRLLYIKHFPFNCVTITSCLHQRFCVHIEKKVILFSLLTAYTIPSIISWHLLCIMKNEKRKRKAHYVYCLQKLIYSHRIMLLCQRDFSVLFIVSHLHRSTSSVAFVVYSNNNLVNHCLRGLLYFGSWVNSVAFLFRFSCGWWSIWIKGKCF